MEDQGVLFLERMTDEALNSRLAEAAARLEEETAVLLAGHALLLRRHPPLEN